jgi:hypothetical protein
MIKIIIDNTVIVTIYMRKDKRVKRVIKKKLKSKQTTAQNKCKL